MFHQKLDAMATSFNRRQWLKTGLLGSSLPLLQPWQLLDHLQEPVPGPSGKMPVRLNSNENPFGPSQKSREAVMASLDEGNRYPRTAINKLKEAIAQKEGVGVDQVLITAGSTEILGLMGLIYGLRGGNIVAGDPTFDYLMIYSELIGAKWKRIPLTPDKYFDLEAMGKAVDGDTRMIFICNPNNPTGTYIPKAEVSQFCEKYGSNVPIFIDEAYIEFTDGGVSNSLKDMVSDNPNIVVGRTFSKVYGLAGMRIGYALGHPDTIKVMQQFCMGRMITPSVPSMYAAMASMDDKWFTDMTVEKTMQGKAMVYDFCKQQQVRYIPSHTNFIWFEADRFKGDLVKTMASKDILIRSYADQPGWYRVSIGTPAEIQTFIDAAGLELV